MEYLDVCDENGAQTGIKKTKKEAHDQGLWHRAAHVWIVNSKKEILLQKRSPNIDNFPNKWDISTAGHISAGETDIASAARETKEELGLDVKLEDFLHIGTVKEMSSRPGYINNEIDPVYVIRMDIDPKNIIKQKEEVSDVKYVKLAEFKDMVERKESSLVQHPEEYDLLIKHIDGN